MTWQIPFGIGIIVASAFLILLHLWDVNRIEDKNDAALKAQVTFNIKQCDADKQITTNASSDYENKINALNDQLDKLRQQPARIVYVTKQASGSNATAPGHINAGSNAIDSSKFTSYGGSCEKLRLQVIGLQDFINKTWVAKGQ